MAALKDIKDFAAQAGSMNGAELVSLIKEVLSAKNVFSFGELLLVPAVQEVSQSDIMKCFDINQPRSI